MERLELLLRAKLGNFVPHGRHSLVDRTWSRKFGQFIMKPLLCDNEEIRGEIKEYAKNTFYKDCVVPSLLGLWKSDEEAKSIFEKEMDLYLDSGASFVLRCNETGKLRGFSLICIWTLDSNYEAIHGFSMREWHIVSAKIAMDVNPTRPEPIWRELQYLHLYNESQIVLAKKKHKFCMYFGPGYMAPDARGLGIFNIYFHEFGKLAILNGGICFGVPTVQALRNKGVNKLATELGHISYSDQVLQTSDGMKVFGPIEKKGGLSLMMSESSNHPAVIQYVIAFFQVLMRTSSGRIIVMYILFLEYYLRTWFNKS